MLYSTTDLFISFAVIGQTPCQACDRLLLLGGRTMTTVSILGSGIMGTALSFPLSDNGHEVRLVGTHLDRDIIDSIKKTGIHPGLDRKVPETVRAYQLEEAKEAFEG